MLFQQQDVDISEYTSQSNKNNWRHDRYNGHYIDTRKHGAMLACSFLVFNGCMFFKRKTYRFYWVCENE